MFSVHQKRAIADAVHRILRDTEHPELPKRGQPIKFHLHVDGAESWSWADIQNNEAVTTPGVNPWNERQAAAAASLDEETPATCPTCKSPDRDMHPLTGRDDSEVRPCHDAWHRRAASALVERTPEGTT